MVKALVVVGGKGGALQQRQRWLQECLVWQEVSVIATTLSLFMSACSLCPNALLLPLASF